MNVLGIEDKLVEVAELKRKRVRVASVVSDADEYGILHAITEHGVLIKSDKGYYILIPWHNIRWVSHTPKDALKSVDLPQTEKTPEEDPLLKDKERLILLSLADRIQVLLQEDDDSYEAGIDDNGDIEITYDDDEIAIMSDGVLKVSDNDYSSEMSNVAKEFDLKLEVE